LIGLKKIAFHEKGVIKVEGIPYDEILILEDLHFFEGYTKMFVDPNLAIFFKLLYPRG
jgi:hypothetical protein